MVPVAGLVAICQRQIGNESLSACTAQQKRPFRRTAKHMRADLCNTRGTDNFPVAFSSRMMYNQFLTKRIAGLSEVWYRAWFGTKRPWVRIPQPGPEKILPIRGGSFLHIGVWDSKGRHRSADRCKQVSGGHLLSPWENPADTPRSGMAIESRSPV